MQEHSNTQRMPYLYTGKKLDEETGLYYYGARYYDPRTSVCQSEAPILGAYLPTGRNTNLPGGGGVFSPDNLGHYSYSGLRPLRFVDPTGQSKEEAEIILKAISNDMNEHWDKARVSLPGGFHRTIEYGATVRKTEGFFSGKTNYSSGPIRSSLDGNMWERVATLNGQWVIINKNLW